MPSDFLPSREAELVTWIGTFKALITAGPTTYGLVAAQATSYGTLATNFINAYNLANADATRTPSNIISKRTAKTAVIANTRLLARIIQATPTVTDAQKSDLGLNVRATPTPVGPPGTPYKLVVTLQPTGWLEMKWKCDNSTRGGVFYNVYRTLDDATTMEYLGGSGQRKFIDSSVPSGTRQVTYQIQSVRTTVVGVAAEFVVKFGVDSGDAMITSITESKPVKVAA